MTNDLQPQKSPAAPGMELLVGLSVTDDEGYAAYRAEMTPLLQAVGGDFGCDFVVSRVLKAPTADPVNRVFTIRFPSRSEMEAFFSDPRYMGIKDQHFARSVSHTTILAEYDRSK